MEGINTVYFVFEGSIREFEGSIMGLQCQLSDDEWKQIIDETISYKVFLKCLKRTGMPLLNEKWDDDDDQFIVGLTESVSAMKKLDPLLTGSINEKKLKKIYTVKMKDGADDINKLIRNVVKDLKGSKRSQVSDL